ncbi:hypothetical protein J5X84_26350 [Streptosporangiaceae bacterium NEAU-GS5]|nr:hypothetical protein [Streptosporangiaceae bacterium NEAU-GS5]
MTPESLPLAVKGAVLRFWRELPRCLVAGLIMVGTAVPLAVALATAAPYAIVAGATVPPALALTGLARFAAAVARGDGPDLALLRRIDPVLALLIAGGASVIGFGVAGAVIGAGLLLLAPYALAYGAIRGRRGLAALRGAAILVAYRPSWALTLAALGCLGGFAVAASAGVLAPALPPLLLTIAATQTGGLLDEIDALQGRGWPARR